MSQPEDKSDEGLKFNYDPGRCHIIVYVYGATRGLYATFWNLGETQQTAKSKVPLRTYTLQSRT